MLLVQPSENGDNDVWDTLLTALFLLIDAHDHTTGKGVKVPLSGVSITADLNLASGGNYYAATNAKAIDFQPQASAAMSAYAGALFCNSLDNELYWRNTSGTLVKMTSGSSINASLIGGIGGDYASVSALVDYTDATDTYALRQQVGASVRQYGKVAHADLDLYEYFASGASPVPANRVRIKSPASLAASYDLTLPAALPASIAVLHVSAAGAITALTTLPTLNVTALTASTIAVGTATASADFVVSGTGQYKHGEREFTLGGSAFQPAGAGTGAATISLDGSLDTAGSVSRNYFAPIQLKAGERITSITPHFSNSNGCTTDLRKQNLLASSSSITTATTDGTPVTVNYTIQAGYQVYLSVAIIGTVSFPTSSFYGVTVKYDRP